MKDWYGIDWRQLRTQLLKLCLSHADMLLADTETGAAATTFIRAISADIQRRTAQDRIGLWENALPLLARPDKLRNRLLAELRKSGARGQSPGKTVSPRQALGRTLSQFFEEARRDLVAGDLDISPNRLKTWERLDRISRRLAADNNTPDRCTEQHFAELAALIRQDYAHDRNLPRKPDTVRTYFFQFSDDCSKQANEPDSALENFPATIPREIMRGVGMETLATCLDQLDADDQEYMDVAFSLGISTVQYRKKSDFFESRSLSESSFAIRLGEILDRLRDCLELALTRMAYEVVT